MLLMNLFAGQEWDAALWIQQGGRVGQTERAALKHIYYHM